MRATTLGLTLSLLASSTLAGAQGAVAQAPPPAQAPLPAQAPPPAQPYPPQGPPPATYDQYVESHTYRQGDPIPRGYHLEEQMRGGLVKAGIIVTAIPYAIAVFAAIGADYANKSGWLVVPWVGPWLTLGQRRYPCRVDEAGQGPSNSLKCVGEVFLMTGLILDGLVQVGGGALLLVGILNTKPVLVPDDQAKIHITPMNVGSGYGAGLTGVF